MNICEQTKRELCKNVNSSSCCDIASLSSFVRTAGSIIYENGNYGFYVTGQGYCLDHFAEIIKNNYDIDVIFGLGKNKINSFTLLNEKSFEILIDLGILKINENNNITIEFVPNDYLTENQCCKKAYITGAFLGGGSLTVPEIDNTTSTGYHLEFVFSNYLTASSFCNLISEVGYLPKLIERNGNNVVYFKQNEEIQDILALMGANKSVLKLTQLVVVKEMKNKANRLTNCEMYNVSKQVEASIKQRKAIKIISETIGLDRLTDELKSVALARVQNEESTLNELAQILNISKSCLNHRLRRIVEIAEEL